MTRQRQILACEVNVSSQKEKRKKHFKEREGKFDPAT